MKEEDVIRVFGEATLLLPSGSTVPAFVFAQLFKDAGSDPTYVNLVDLDGGKLGYKDFFDKCKEQGILN